MSLQPTVSSLPQFLRFLSGLPDADGMIHALVRGPMLTWGSTRGTFLSAASTELVSQAAYGYPAEQVRRYARFPLSIDLPAARAMRGPSITRVESLLDDFMVLRLDASAWLETIRANGPGNLIAFPVGGTRRPLGVVSVMTSDAQGASVPSAQALEALGAVLGLWWSHPLTPRERATISVPETALRLTDRQQEILRLVDTGATNSAIASRLGYSESTVKQEVTRAIHALRAHDRRDAVLRARDLGLL